MYQSNTLRRVDDTSLLEGFASGSLEPFRHADHVRVAWLLLRRQPVTVALAELEAGLRRLAVAAHGHDGRYHATVTWAYALLVRERMERGGRLADWDAFAAANPDLLERGGAALEPYYRPATLRSDLARRVFVLPDRGLDGR